MNGTRFSLILFVYLGIGCCSSTRSQSFDCTKAKESAERAICSEPTLRHLDTELTQNYLNVRRKLSPALLQGFVSAQREWLSRRNQRCATGAIECLRQAYAERNDYMLALLARTAEDNPVIDSTDAAVLLGDWSVGSSAHTPDVTTPALTPTAAHLPAEGARVAAKLGEVCITNPGEPPSCSSFGLAVDISNSHAGAPVVLTYFDGRADFELAVHSKAELVASYRACDATAKHCRALEQHWHAMSADARLQLYSAQGELGSRWAAKTEGQLAARSQR